MTVLYHGEPVLYALKPLIALEEKGVAYERRRIGVEPLERAVPGFPPGLDQAIALEGEGPVLVDDGQTIVGSFFMLEYIAERFGGTPLLPADPLDHYRAQGVGQLVAGVVAPFVSAIAVGRHPVPAVALDGVEPVERRGAWVQAASGDRSAEPGHIERLAASLARLEALLGGQSWFAGDYSIADIDAFAMIRPIPDLAPGLIGGGSPLHDFIARMEERPAVQAASRLGWGGDPGLSYLPGPEISRWG